MRSALHRLVPRLQRAAKYACVRELSGWFGGAPTALVVYLDAREGAVVEVDRVIPREAGP
jgi:hypothetical protein